MTSCPPFDCAQDRLRRASSVRAVLIVWCRRLRLQGLEPASGRHHKRQNSMALTALHRYGFDWAGLRSRGNGVWADPWKWWIKRYSTIHIQGEKPNVFIFATSRT